MALVDVIIPAYNEENAISYVIEDIPKDIVRHIIVVDNNSRDDTRLEAEKRGAIVLDEEYQGYGAACLKGISYLDSLNKPPEIVIFLDADHSDHPEQLQELLEPINKGKADLVIGTRTRRGRQKGAMTFPQVFGNALATRLLKWFYGAEFTDLGPFRAIRYTVLKKINMKDRTFGWTVEMQLKIAKKGYRYKEVPVRYRKRKGRSKISGTVKGTILAGYKILDVIFRHL